MRTVMWLCKHLGVAFLAVFTVWMLSTLFGLHAYLLFLSERFHAFDYWRIFFPVLVPMKYSNNGSIAVGYVDCQNESAPESCKNGGYFMIDIRAREHYFGLSATGLELSLRERGVRDIPTLKRPQGHHAWFTFLQK